MKEYIEYKEWWMENEAKYKIPSLYWGATAEEAFEQHVRDLGLYELMEKLVDRYKQ
jgi:hypothetical protein